MRLSNMLALRLLRYSAILCVCHLGTVVSAPAEDPKTLEEVDARIQGLEMELIQAQAERFRVKNRIEYGDKELEPLRIKSRQLEARIAELRKDYEERLIVLDETLRGMNAEVSRKFKEVSDLELLKEAIQRETTLAADQGGAAKVELARHLQVEQEQMDAQLNTARLDIQRLTGQLTERKQEITAGDKKARATLEELNEAEAEYADISSQLHGKINERPEVKKLDDPRVELASELQRLRDLKKKLQAEQPR